MVDGHISGMYLSADHHGQGVGSAILERMEKDAQEAGVAEMTADSTLPALGFYKSKGYEEVERRILGRAQLEVVSVRKRFAEAQTDA